MKKNNLIFLSIIIFGAVALGVIGLFIGLGVKKSDRKPSGNVVVMPNEEIVLDNDGNKLNDGDFHPMPTGMLFAPSALANTQNEEMTVNVIATITPNDAANKAVDWNVAFVNASSAWANGKAATDYITAEPTTDGALTATVTCKAAFGEQIKITVTSRDNPDASASCTVDYKQQFEGYLFSASQTGKTPTLNNSTKKGTIYADFNTLEQLKITYSYKKSTVYTVALNDSEITAPATLDVSIDDDSLKEAMNAAKSGSGDAFKVTPADKVFTMDLFNKKLVESATPAQVNAIITAVPTSSFFPPITFSFKDGAGNPLMEFKISINTTAIKGQKKVEKITLDQPLLVFGAKIYNITYKCAGDTSGETLFQSGSEYGLSKKADGVYPTFYCEGTTPAISDLKSSFSCGEGYHSGGGVIGTGHYNFEGWYLDNEMTKPFSGTIPAGTTGDITLYAKITSTGTHNY